MNMSRYRRSYDWIQRKRGGEWVDNDEGYYYAFCSYEGKRTEHGRLEGCISCMNKDIDRHASKR